MTQQFDMLADQWDSANASDALAGITPADSKGFKMDPVTVTALISAGSKVLGGALGGSGPAGPSRADQSVYQTFDNSGWTVATGKASASASVSQLPWAWIIGGAVVLLLVWKRA